MSADEQSRRKVEAQVPEEEHDVASGRRSWMPAVLLGSVIGVVGVVVAIGLGIALLVYFLA